MTQRTKAKYQLPLQTTDLVVAFMIWVILSSLMPFIKQDIPLSLELTSWVIAVPVILGSVLRIPFGYLTGRFGSKPVYLVSFCVLVFPIVFISQAQSAADLIIGGIVLGVAGAVFSVGVSSIPKYYPKERQGFVNGVYGLGNIGTAVSAFGAPPLAVAFGWQTTVLLYLIPSLVMVVLNLLFGDSKEKKLKTPVIAQIKAIAPDSRLWAYSFFYFITFGAFVACTMFLPDFLVENYGFSGETAGVATGIFIVIAACLRVVGGWLADKLPPRKILVVVFAGMLIGAACMATLPALPLFLVGVYLLSIGCGIGNGTVFKMVPSAFAEQLGIASGVVAMLGSLGGFFPPLVLSFCFAATGSFFMAFVLFIVCIIACLLLIILNKKY